MYNIQVHVPYEKQQYIKKMNHYITEYSHRSRNTTDQNHLSDDQVKAPTLEDFKQQIAEPHLTHVHAFPSHHIYT